MNELITIKNTKEDIKALVKELYEEVLQHIPHSIQEKRLQDLLRDIETDFHTVVVLGEFKRGKSTFMNALLGQSLLPVDVTPTTATINALMWGDEPALQVYHADGSISDMDLSGANLQKYVASSDFDPEQVKYLKLAIPHPILKDNVVFIDTPGVGDINQQRVEVTYNFIPRADVVIFLLDGTSPVKRSEYVFLTEMLLKQGLDRILFLINFKDELDEEEEEEVLEMVKRRLGKAIPDLNEDRIMFMSAYQALEGKLEEDLELMEESQITAVERAVQAHIQTGSLDKEKNQRYHTRLANILDGTKREITSILEIQSLSVEEIREELVEITKKLNGFETTKTDLLDYVEDREAEINVMVAKSLKYFGDTLLEDLMSSIDQYQGLNLKDYVEKQLPQMIKKRMKQWIEQYIGQIHKLLQILEREIAIGLASEFNASVQKLNIRNGPGLVTRDHSGNLEISSEDISNTPIIAGLIAGGAGTIAMLLGGPLLLPILGMAGFPFIQKHLVEKKLVEAKEKLKPELSSRLNEVLNQFYMEVKEYLATNTTAIRKAAESRYQELVASVEKQLQGELARQQTSHKGMERQAAKLQTLLAEIETFQSKLERL